MGKRGKPPLPSSVIDIRGGARHYHRKKEDLELEPNPNPNIPPCPDHLDAVAKEEWDRVVEEIEALGIVTNLDMSVLASYCNSYSRWVRATTKVNEEGYFYTLPNGYQQQNANLSIANKAEEMMLRAAGKLGFTPSDRSQVKRVDNPNKQEDRKERFFK